MRGEAGDATLSNASDACRQAAGPDGRLRAALAACQSEPSRTGNELHVVGTDDFAEGRSQPNSIPTFAAYVQLDAHARETRIARRFHCERGGEACMTRKGSLARQTPLAGGSPALCAAAIPTLESAKATSVTAASPLRCRVRDREAGGVETVSSIGEPRSQAGQGLGARAHADSQEAIRGDPKGDQRRDDDQVPRAHVAAQVRTTVRSATHRSVSAFCSTDLANRPNRVRRRK